MLRSCLPRRTAHARKTDLTTRDVHTDRQGALLEKGSDDADMTNQPPFLLRAERPEDLHHLGELLVAVDAAWGVEPFRVAVREGGLDAAKVVISRPKIDSVVAEANGSVVGHGALRQEADIVMVVNMLVTPEFQGRGIGRALVTEMCRRVVAPSQHVHLDVLLDSHAAHALYYSLGFREFAVTTGKLSGREGRLMCLVPNGTRSCEPAPSERL
jgi:ribosomal protein S18 acetylase RimI-like enzyme